MNTSQMIFQSFYVCGLASLLFVIGCSSNQDLSQDVESASIDTVVADEQVEAESAEENTLVIDVRSEEEWNAGHVSSAVHIPHTEIAERIGEVTEDKAAKIVVYCRVGGRAGIAKTKLEELGYTNIENGGGFDDVKDRFK